MFSSKKVTLSLIPVLITPAFFLGSCSERSEYGDASDYKKYGYDSQPTVSSVNPTDNSTSVAVSTTTAVTFSKQMSTGSVTTNTSDTTCSGSFQLSSDNFTTCIKMTAAPSASNSDKTFTSTPADNLSEGTTYKLKLTTSVKDAAGNTLSSAYTTNGFTTYSPFTSGSGTIKGSIIKQSDSSALSGVSVTYTVSGSTTTITSDSSGNYGIYALTTGDYTLSYSSSGYIDETQTATLSTDNETVVISTLKMLSSSCASTGTVSGKITDAVSGDNVTGVDLSARRGLYNTSGTVVGTDTTDSSGYSFTGMSRGWYTVQTSKSDYIGSTFHVVSCGDIDSQDASISGTLSSGNMRIVLSWPKTTPETGKDLDSHLTGPDNGTDRFHIYWNASDYYNIGHWSDPDNYYYHTDNYTCSGCTTEQASDNVTLDRDSQKSPGTETITIIKVRSGTYRYSVHDYSNKDNSSSTKLANSGASVTVYYNNTTTSYNVPNIAGNLWGVFTLDGSTGVLSASDNMTAHSDYNTIQ